MIESRVMKDHVTKNTEKAFTLVEVAVVLLIGGMILGFVTSSLLTYIRNTQVKATERKLEEIDEAVQLFISLNGRLPCVAGFDDAPDTADFGVEIDDTDCPGAAATPGETYQNSGVRAGSVPVRTLNIPDDYIMDAWGNRFTFAVTEDLATTAGYDPTAGAVEVIDSAGNSIVDPAGTGTLAQYVVVSHGPNGAGAAVLGGAGPTACTPGNLEEENCDFAAFNGIFRSTLLVATANNANLYDDLVKIRTNTVGIIPSGAVMAFDLPGDCPSGWTPFNTANERFIIGASRTVGGAYQYADPPDGNEQITLESDEIGIETVDINAPVVAAGTGTPVARQLAGFLPHDNMPPYVALFYCRKS